MARYRKKPLVIEAWQWVGCDDFTVPLDDAPGWVKGWTCSGEYITLLQDGSLSVPTLEGIHIASVGDWLIQGVAGEVYPCKPHIFKATYKEVS